MKSGFQETINRKTELFDEQALRTISETYGIPDLQYVTSPQHGTITDNAILKDKSDHFYFAKWYEDENAEDPINAYRAAESLVDAGIPILLPIMLLDKSYTAHIQGRSLALFPYVEHRESPPRDESEDLRLTISMIEELGRIHAVVPPEHTSIRQIERWSPDGETHRQARLRKIIEHIENIPNRNSFDELAIRTITERLALLSKLEPPSHTSSPLRICHGDFHKGNVLYDEDMNIVAICDWDNAGLANPWVDFFNTFMPLIVGNKIDTLETDTREITEAFVSSYFKGLQHSDNINHEALRAGFDILMRERIGTSWPIYQHYFERNHRYDDRVEKIYKRAVWYAENYEAIWNFVQSIMRNVLSQSQSDPLT